MTLNFSVNNIYMYCYSYTSEDLLLSVTHTCRILISFVCCYSSRIICVQTKNNVIRNNTDLPRHDLYN